MLPRIFNTFADTIIHRMKQLILTFSALFIAGLIYAAIPYRTRIHASNIKTLQINISGGQTNLPIINLNDDRKIEIRFDEMSHESHNYLYTVIHCNADWTASDITSNEYLEGYTNGYINEYQRSKNTTYLYTNYRLTLPNEDIRFKISGNYTILIYEEDRKEKPIAQACFSIVDPKVIIRPTLRYNTDIEMNGRYQQLDLEVLFGGYSVLDPMTEIKMTVRQNNRIDNEASNIIPNYVSNSKITYINNKSLIFEGGNEYHNFDISSFYTFGRGVDKIKYTGNSYDAFLFPDKIQTGSYLHDFDINGKFLINHQEAFEDIHTEADYMKVHFTLPMQYPFFDGQLYLGGEFNYNLFDSKSLLHYDRDKNAYTKTVLLKQGGYNYQYWFVPKGLNRATLQRVEGSYWQAKNEYTVYIYHREWGGRYDKLVGVSTIE